MSIHNTSTTNSLISADHTSEGFLVTLPNGDILNFFRLDPGISGDHVGNNGKIVKRKSIDNGQTWEAIQDVYNDEWDDRNIHGGITNEGRIVIFFRRFDSIGYVGVDTNFIYSDDNGETWSQRQVINTTISAGTNDLVAGTARMFYVPTKGYAIALRATWYCEIRFSADGSNWDNYVIIRDYRVSGDFAIDEVCIAYVGYGRLIGLFRDQSLTGNYFQMISSDYGETWTNPVRTNIASPHFTPAPHIFYDTTINKVIVLATDRRDTSGTGLREESSFWIYVNNPDDVFSNPNGYSLVSNFLRPKTNSNRVFYGYPVITKTKDSNYLIVFTDCVTEGNGTEDADLYQFSMTIDNEFTVIHPTRLVLNNDGDIQESKVMLTQDNVLVPCGIFVRY